MRAIDSENGSFDEMDMDDMFEGKDEDDNAGEDDDEDDDDEIKVSGSSTIGVYQGYDLVDNTLDVLFCLSIATFCFDDRTPSFLSGGEANHVFEFSSGSAQGKKKVRPENGYEENDGDI